MARAPATNTGYSGVEQRGNVAFIANQMGHKDYSMLPTVYGRWIDTESCSEFERTWESMQIWLKLHQNYTKNPWLNS